MKTSCKVKIAQGFTPMTWLTTQIFDAQDLPEGSLQHLLDCSEEIVQTEGILHGVY